MRRALELARATLGLASPNPQVGCVLVRDGTIVGEGAHRYEQRDHAEIVALRAAGERARGATAYVTLEPCSHHGRTGPCADALVAAGVSRVVTGTLDANPLVAGQGLDRLRQAGVSVELGLCQDEAREINDAFACWVRTCRPLVTSRRHSRRTECLLLRRTRGPRGRRSGSAAWRLVSRCSGCGTRRTRC